MDAPYFIWFDTRDIEKLKHQYDLIKTIESGEVYLIGYGTKQVYRGWTRLGAIEPMGWKDIHTREWKTKFIAYRGDYRTVKEQEFDEFDDAIRWVIEEAPS